MTKILLASVSAVALLAGAQVSIAAGAGPFELGSDVDVTVSTGSDVSTIDATTAPYQADLDFFVGFGAATTADTSDRSISVTGDRQIDISVGQVSADVRGIFVLGAAAPGAVNTNVDIDLTQNGSVAVEHNSGNSAGSAMGIDITTGYPGGQDEGDQQTFGSGDITAQVDAVSVTSTSANAHGIFAATHEGSVMLDVDGAVTVNGTAAQAEDAIVSPTVGVLVDGTGNVDVDLAGNVTVTDASAAFGVSVQSREGEATLSIGTEQSDVNILVQGSSVGGQTSYGAGAVASGGTGATVTHYGDATLVLAGEGDVLYNLGDGVFGGIDAALGAVTEEGNASVTSRGDVSAANGSGIAAVTQGGDASVNAIGDVTGTYGGIFAVVGLGEETGFVDSAIGDANITIEGSTTKDLLGDGNATLTAVTGVGSVTIEVLGEGAEVRNGAALSEAIYAYAADASGDGDLVDVNVAADIISESIGVWAQAVNGDVEVDITGDVTAVGVGLAAVADTEIGVHSNSQSAGSARATVVGNVVVTAREDSDTTEQGSTAVFGVVSQVNQGNATSLVTGSVNTAGTAIAAFATDGDTSATLVGDRSLEDGYSVIAGDTGVYANAGGVGHTATVSASGGVAVDGNAAFGLVALSDGDAEIYSGVDSTGAVINGGNDILVVSEGDSSNPSDATAIVALGLVNSSVVHVGDITLDADNGKLHDHLNGVPEHLPAALFDALLSSEDTSTDVGDIRVVSLPGESVVVVLALNGDAILDVSGDIRTGHTDGSSSLTVASFAGDAIGVFAGSISGIDGASDSQGGLLVGTFADGGTATGEFELIGETQLGEALLQVRAIGDGAGIATGTISGNGSAVVTGHILGSVSGNVATLNINDAPDVLSQDGFGFQVEGTENIAAEEEEAGSGASSATLNLGTGSEPFNGTAVSGAKCNAGFDQANESLIFR